MPRHPHETIFLSALALLLCSCAHTVAPPEGNIAKLTCGSGKQVIRPGMEIIIVDGIWGTHWDLHFLRKHLNREVAPARIWRYDNTGFSSLEKAAAALVTDLQASQRPVCLVGFSMGGLVIREALRQAPDLPLQKAVFLNSPHSGSLVAHLLPLPACREMRPGSRFLHRLEASPWDYPTMVTWCSGDLMIIPGESARWAKATHTLRFTMPAHLWPLISPNIHRSIADFLKK